VTAGTFSGRGKLSPGAISIEYELTRELVKRPKTSQHPSFDRWESTVTIRGSGEQSIAEGIYELTLEDGTTERVKNQRRSLERFEPFARISLNRWGSIPNTFCLA
jgi:hypothetical protein